MKIEQKIVAQLNDLIQEADNLIENKKNEERSLPIIVAGQDLSTYEVETVELIKGIQWGISCLHTLGKVFGENSIHYQNFLPITRSSRKIMSWEIFCLPLLY